MLKAAALAQKRSGAALMIHPGRHEGAPMEIVTILQEVKGRDRKGKKGDIRERRKERGTRKRRRS